jgi:hypothetical protein
MGGQRIAIREGARRTRIRKILRSAEVRPGLGAVNGLRDYAGLDRNNRSVWASQLLVARHGSLFCPASLAVFLLSCVELILAWRFVASATEDPCCYNVTVDTPELPAYTPRHTLHTRHTAHVQTMRTGPNRTQ